MKQANPTDVLNHARELIIAGQLEEAKELARNACKGDKSNVELRLLLGNICGQLQQFDDAIRSFRYAVDQAPDDSRAHFGLANALYAANRLDDAAQACRRAIELQPVRAEYWQLLAMIYGLLGNPDEAADCLRQVIELTPGDAQAYRSLGYIQQTQNRLDDALASYKKAVECKADFADVYNDIGLVLQEQGQIQEAIAQYKQSLRIRPDFIAAMINLGDLLLTRFQMEEAQKYFESVLAIDKENPRALCGLGISQLERGYMEEAHNSFNRALSLDPTYEKATVNIARLHERQGNYDEALALLQPLIDRGDNKDAITAFALLSTHFQLEKKAIELMEHSLSNGKPTSAQKAEMHFLLGKLYDKMEKYYYAFRNFEMGNQLKTVDFRSSEHTRLVDSLIDTYCKENLPALAHGTPSDRQPVFIVGMPRSGTSLVEQILSVHPHVQAAGELTLINRFAAMMQEMLHTRHSYPEGILNLTRDDLESLAQQYLNELPPEGDDRAFFTDKMPHNFLHLGLIQQIFPNARVVHCIRDARDTCLSCYTYDFSGVHPYAYDLQTLGEYYLQYQRLMKHWGTVLSIPIYHLDYEQLVSDQEREIRKLVEFCSLEWDDRCLDFHTSNRLVLTSSYDQVRRPMYNSSIGRWKHYERHIQPLLKVLKLAD